MNIFGGFAFFVFLSMFANGQETSSLSTYIYKSGLWRFSLATYTNSVTRIDSENYQNGSPKHQGDLTSLCKHNVAQTIFVKTNMHIHTYIHTYITFSVEKSIPIFGATSIIFIKLSIVGLDI
jgi:hypothetical protein